MEWLTRKAPPQSPNPSILSGFLNRPPALDGERQTIRPPFHPLCKAKLWSELKLRVNFFSVKTTYKHYITLSPQAKEIFEKICPDEEFLQPVPNPEDIILDDFLQDANQNATQPGLDAQANAVDPDSGEEPPALTTEGDQAGGSSSVSKQSSGEESPTEQDQAEGGSGVSNQPSVEENPVLATEQEQAYANGGESSQPSEEDSQSGTVPSDP